MLLYWPVRIIAFWHVPEKGPRACNSRGFLSMNKPFGMFPSLGSLPLFVRLPCPRTHLTYTYVTRNATSANFPLAQPLKSSEGQAAHNAFVAIICYDPVHPPTSLLFSSYLA